jgi:hypothetical protein
MCEASGEWVNPVFFTKPVAAVSSGLAHSGQNP